ncbi:MAG TPA: hypothetical protein VFP61_01300 [Acidimicrobiales bacterium]|nr:hypothetical protein [Acidimicrobiales bacterium]
MARLEHALLCHSAISNADGTQSILGAGINGVAVAEPLPAPLQITVVLQVAWGENELAQGHRLGIGVRTQAGDRLADIRSLVVPLRGSNTHPGAIRSAGVLPLPFVVEDFGEHLVEVRVDDEILASMSLWLLPAAGAG